MYRRPAQTGLSQTSYGNSPTWAALLFLGYVLFFYLQGGYRFPSLGAVRFELIMGIVLGLAAMYTLSQRTRRAGSRPTSIPKWVIAMLVAATVMTVLSKEPAISFQMYTDRVLKFMLMAVFIAAFVDSPTRLRWFLFAYLLAFFKMAQEGVVGLITGGMVWENQGTPRLHGTTPNYTHPNSFSGTQLGTLPFLVGLLPVVRGWWRIAIIVQAVAATAVVITTGSRTGYVGLALWGAIAVWKAKSRLRAIAVVLLLVAVAVPFVPQDYFDRFETIFTQQDKEGQSIETRKVILEDAWKIFSDSPFGVGVGAFTEVRTKVFGRSQPTHNLYFEVACDMGIQGLIIFLGLLASLVYTARRLSLDVERQLARLPKPEQTRNWTTERLSDLAAHAKDLGYMHAAARGVYGLLVIRMGLGLFGHDFYEIYWWFAAGLLIALNNMVATATNRTAQYTEGLTPQLVEKRKAAVTKTPRFATSR